MTAAAGARPQVFAHRGASAARPENTLDAFRHARELGADWVELDVRAHRATTRFVVHHDAHLPDGRALGRPRSAELPASVPTLDEALDACAGLLASTSRSRTTPATPTTTPPASGRGGDRLRTCVARGGSRSAAGELVRPRAPRARARASAPSRDGRCSSPTRADPVRLVERIAEADTRPSTRSTTSSTPRWSSGRTRPASASTCGRSTIPTRMRRAGRARASTASSPTSPTSPARRSLA